MFLYIKKSILYSKNTAFVSLFLVCFDVSFELKDELRKISMRLVDTFSQSRIMVDLYATLRGFSVVVVGKWLIGED